MAMWKMRALRIAVFVRRHPYVFALLGFGSGVLSFILVDRQEEMARLVAAFVLAGWVLLLLEKPCRSLVTRISGIVIPPPVVHFSAQLVHQESFFFVLPFFFITTTWTSEQAVFTAAIAAAALVSIWDPVYYGQLAKRRWLYFAYHSTAMFVVLLTTLPIIFHLRTIETYAVATALTMICAIPSLAARAPVRSAAAVMRLMALVLALGAVAWFGRTIVPPATFWLTDSAITDALDEEMRSVSNPLESVCEAQLRGGRLYAFTAIRAPRGLREEIRHEWTWEQQFREPVPVEIFGGREAGYRIWTYKENFPENPQGRWQVRVKTESDQLLGIIRFRVDC